MRRQLDPTYAFFYSVWAIENLNRMSGLTLLELVGLLARVHHVNELLHHHALHHFPAVHACEWQPEREARQAGKCRRQCLILRVNTSLMDFTAFSQDCATASVLHILIHKQH